MVLSMLPVEMLSVWGGRRLKTRKEQDREGEKDPSVWHDNRLDLFDKRLALVRRMHSWRNEEGIALEQDPVRHVSVFEFYWKYYWSRKRLVRAPARCLVVTPAFCASCARGDHERHGDYARTQVLAYWLLMPTATRVELYKTCVASGQMAPVNELQLGASFLRDHGRSAADRCLGVDDLYQLFHF